MVFSHSDSPVEQILSLIYEQDPTNNYFLSNACGIYYLHCMMKNLRDGFKPSPYAYIQKMHKIFSLWFNEDRAGFNEAFFKSHVIWCPITVKAFLEAESTILDLHLTSITTASFLCHLFSGIAKDEVDEIAVRQKIGPYMCRVFA